MQIRRHEKPFPFVVAWAVVTLAAVAGTGRLSIGQSSKQSSKQSSPKQGSPNQGSPSQGSAAEPVSLPDGCTPCANESPRTTAGHANR